MTLLAELQIFAKNILHWVYAFIFFSFFFFIFGLKEVVIWGRNILLPLPTTDSFTASFFNKIRHDLLPSDVSLITTNPISPFVSQVLFSVLLSFIVTLPFFLYKLILYIRPALLPAERKAVIWSLLPITALFICGSIFSYLFIIPTTFKVLYPYATTMGVVPYFSLDEFIHYVFSLIFAVGFMFLLPVFMALFSLIGIIPAEFWRRKWQTACFIFLILSAIITPDGTGVTMVMLFLPLVVLYFLGYLFAKKVTKEEQYVRSN